MEMSVARLAMAIRPRLTPSRNDFVVAHQEHAHDVRGCPRELERHVRATTLVQRAEMCLHDALIQRRLIGSRHAAHVDLVALAFGILVVMLVRRDLDHVAAVDALTAAGSFAIGAGVSLAMPLVTPGAAAWPRVVARFAAAGVLAFAASLFT